MRLKLRALARCAVLSALLVPAAVGPATATTAETEHYANLCSRGSPLCPEVSDSASAFGEYIGHDEPSLLFYSNQPGSGNSSRYLLRLPEEPPTLPKTDGTGGTFNFQLHPAFWFGMALCDSESSPTPGLKDCPPDTDANIFDGSDPNAPDYIGKHPGSAFLELQFFPPGWVPWPASQIINGGSSCDARQWCAAMLIFSLERNETVQAPGKPPGTRLVNNQDCLSRAGIESINFAFVTLDGRTQGPPSPLFQTTDGTFTPKHGRTLFMDAGDILDVDIHDTPAGLHAIVRDLSTGQSGSMTASIDNGFQQVIFDPNATVCSSRPYAFHPAYATSSEHTRVTWAAHGYNIAFSDEIGHFEYCPMVASADGSGALGTFVCASPTTASDPSGSDADDAGDPNCAPASMSTLVKIDGCTGTDGDFDGPPYRRLWPGSTTNHGLERKLDPQPVRFTSPLFNRTQNYSRVAFEADLAAIEAEQGCSTVTGANCTNPPRAAAFYPLFTTARDLTVGLGADQEDQAGNHQDVARNSCAWQFGGAQFPGTTNTFGGSSATEFGQTLLPLVYPRVGGSVIRFEDYRRVIPNNPCQRGQRED